MKANEYVPAIYPHFASQLSDGIEGGGTAFPKLGVVAFPVKGSVVYWHSLRNDGQTDIRSLHGGCPTVFGVKWGERTQSKSLKDPLLTRLSVFQWPTNGYARELKYGNGRVGHSDLKQNNNFLIYRSAIESLHCIEYVLCNFTQTIHCNLWHHSAWQV